MSGFDEVQFDTRISFESSFGPERQTQVIILGSGFEARNARWQNSLRSGDIGFGLHSMNDIHAVIAFWEARNGRLIGFRFKDWTDYKSCGPDDNPSATDQVIGVGDGTTTTFQLSKLYQSGLSSWTRTVKKPVAGSVLAAVGGVPTTNFSVDTTTGIITFNVAPTVSLVVTAGFEFDTPVRFDSDKLVINLAEWNAGKIPSIPIKEIPL